MRRSVSVDGLGGCGSARGSGRVRWVAALASIVLLCAARAAARDYTPGQERYVEGVRAFDRGDYAPAAAALREALSESGAEGTARFRYKGLNREDYFPHLYLGLTLEKLGDREGAVARLRESERQGAVAARPALSRLLSAALLRLVPPTPAPPTATPPPAPLPSAPTESLPVPEPTRAPVPQALPAIPSSAAPVRPSPRAAAGKEGVRSGLRSFFRGDYASAELLLEPEAPRSPVARLFLSYALAGRYLLAGGSDAALLARARREREAALSAGTPRMIERQWARHRLGR